MTDWGYAVLVTIPFEALRFPQAGRGGPRRWGLGLTRTVPRLNEKVTWPHISRRVEGTVNQLATVTGVQAKAAQRPLRLIPYVAHARARFLEDDGEGDVALGEHHHDRSSKIGLDVQAILRDAYALDLALNPDFSQVAPDAPQVTVNRRFEVLFPERRPFFLENAAAFETPLPLFYSRRIAEPQAGARLVGKTDRWAVGGLLADDREPEDRAWNAVARVQRLFSGGTTLGGFFSGRYAAGRVNQVLAVDGRHRLGRLWVATGQFAHATRQREDEEGESGPAITAQIKRDGRRLAYEAEYQDLGSGFRAELGEIQRRRLGTRQVEQELGYRWWPAADWLVQVGPSLDVMWNWSRSGPLLEREVDVGLAAEIVGQTEVEITQSWTLEAYEDVRFRRRQTQIAAETEWLRRWEAEADVAWGTDVNRDPAGGPPVLANAFELEGELTYRPRPRWRLDQSYTFERLGGRGNAAGQRVYAIHLARTSVQYQASRALSLRLLVDVRVFRPNPDLFDDEPERRLGLDALLTYQRDPFTAVYFGLTDRYTGFDMIEGEDDPDRFGPPFASAARQLFLKISYRIPY